MDTKDDEEQRNEAQRYNIIYVFIANFAQRAAYDEERRQPNNRYF